MANRKQILPLTCIFCAIPETSHLAILIEHAMGKLKWLTFLLIVCTLEYGHAQDPEIQKYGNRITGESLREYLSILASDALEGRETVHGGRKWRQLLFARILRSWA